MKTLNYEYQNKLDLFEFIKQNQIPNNNSVLIQVFSSGLLAEDISLIREQIKEYLPNIQMIGTTTAGIITDGYIEDNKTFISFSLFENSSAKVVSYCHSDDDAILDSLKEYISNRTKFIIVFANLLRFNAENILHQLSDRYNHIVVAGGYAGDDFKFQSCYIFSSTCKDCDIAFAFVDSDVLKVNTNYILNWQTIGKEMMVTKSIGSVVYEINNIKALDIFQHYLGEDISNNLHTNGSEFPLIYRENNTNVARGVIGVDYKGGSITLVGGIKEGTKVKFGYANVEYIENKNKEQIKDCYKFKNEAVYVYTCAARREVLGSYLYDEIGLLNQIGTTTGFITYGEFFHNCTSCRNNLLNVTTTFVTLNENDQNELITFEEKQVKKDKKDVLIKAMTNLITQTSNELEENLNYLEQFKNAVSETSVVSTNEYSNIINGSAAVIKTDLNHQIYNVNQTFCNLSGYMESELLGKDFNQFCHNTIEVDEDPDGIENQKNSSKILSCTSKSGNEYIVATLFHPITNLHGDVVEYLHIMHDISELFRLKENIENEKNKFKTILENIPDILWIKDTKGIYIACNKRFEDFFGALEGDIVGKTDYDFVDKELADFFRQHDMNAMNSAVPLSNFEGNHSAPHNFRYINLPSNSIS
jgi:PAS domain S-box-containing protein